jgi:hypothetical protein
MSVPVADRRRLSDRGLRSYREPEAHNHTEDTMGMTPAAAYFLFLATEQERADAEKRRILRAQQSTFVGRARRAIATRRPNRGAASSR